MPKATMPVDDLNRNKELKGYITLIEDLIQDIRDRLLNLAYENAAVDDHSVGYNAALEDAMEELNNLEEEAMDNYIESKGN